MEHPKEIEKTLLALAFIDEQLRDRRSAIRSLELKITLDAVSAVGEDGKPVLKNEKQRDGAISQLLSESEDYAKVGRELGDLEREKLTLQAQLERLRLEVKIHLLDAEQRNAIAALKVADAIWNARQAVVNYPSPRLINGHAHEEQEVELPF